MPTPMYKLYPSEFMYNTKTERHYRKNGKPFKKLFAADPTIFVESASILPPPNVPATIPERQPEPPPAPPAIGGPIPVPEPVITQEEIKKQVTQRAHEYVQNLVADEIKTNPNPYKGKKSAELEQMLRKFIQLKLEEAEEKENKKSKPKPSSKTPVPKFKLRPIKEELSENEDDELLGENSDDYDDPEY